MNLALVAPVVVLTFQILYQGLFSECVQYVSTDVSFYLQMQDAFSFDLLISSLLCSCDHTLISGCSLIFNMFKLFQKCMKKQKTGNQEITCHFHSTGVWLSLRFCVDSFIF